MTQDKTTPYTHRPYETDVVARPPRVGWRSVVLDVALVVWVFLLVGKACGMCLGVWKLEG